MTKLPPDIGRRIVYNAFGRARPAVTRSQLVDTFVFVAWVALVGLMCLPFL